MAKTAEIFPCSQPIFCESFSCRTERRMGKWFIGSPDGPRQLFMVVCDECKKSIAESLKTLEEPESAKWEEEVKNDPEVKQEVKPEKPAEKPAFTFD